MEVSRTQNSLEQHEMMIEFKFLGLLSLKEHMKRNSVLDFMFSIPVL